MVTLLEGLPRNQVHKLAQAATEGDEAHQNALTRLETVIGKDSLQNAYNTLEALFPGLPDPWRWLHLCELWDYLAPTHRPDSHD